jgi:fermentation-respiration switch protein FrsA (DUF1100 family)
MKKPTFIVAASLMMLGQAYSQNLQTQKEQKMEKTESLTFKLSDKVTKQNVQYKNRYGITVAAHLYVPKDIDKSKKYPALVIGTPYGGVKEQGAGIYAQNMAERGFVALAFDESYNGESSGDPRHVSSPDIFTEDFSAGVDFLGTRSFVDRNKIGAIGICGSGGFAITAAQVDRRIKAVATVSMYDMSRVKRDGWKDGMTQEERNKFLDKIGEQRWEDFGKGTPKMTPSFPAEIPVGLDPITSEFFEYYVAPRGHHPNSIGAFTMSSDFSFMNFPLMNNIRDISPRSILFIIGENAHSRYFSEDAYKLAAEPKELYIVPKARHIDLYDRVDLIPFDKLASFFTQYLQKAEPKEKGSMVVSANN